MSQTYFLNPFTSRDLRPYKFIMVFFILGVNIKYGLLWAVKWPIPMKGLI